MLVLRKENTHTTDHTAAIRWKSLARGDYTLQLPLSRLARVVWWAPSRVRAEAGAELILYDFFPPAAPEYSSPLASARQLWSKQAQCKWHGVLANHVCRPCADFAIRISFSAFVVLVKNKIIPFWVADKRERNVVSNRLEVFLFVVVVYLRNSSPQRLICTCVLLFFDRTHYTVTYRSWWSDDTATR